MFALITVDLDIFLKPTELNDKNPYEVKMVVTEAGKTYVKFYVTRPLADMDREITTGSYFIIQIHTPFGWRDMPYRNKIYGKTWTSEAYPIFENEERHMERSFTKMYGELPKGKYRLVKYYTVRPGFSTIKYHFYAEFSIE